MAHPQPALIRTAKPSDCTAILAAHTAAILELCRGEYSETQLAAWAGRLTPEGYLPAMERNVVVVAEVNGSVVGFGELSLERGEIVAVYVHPSHILKGVGTRLFEELERVATAHGVRELHLDSSLGAVRFYERLGFIAGHPSLHRLGNGAEIPCVPMIRTGAYSA